MLADLTFSWGSYITTKIFSTFPQDTVPWRKHFTRCLCYTFEKELPTNVWHSQVVPRSHRFRLINEVSDKSQDTIRNSWLVDSIFSQERIPACNTMQSPWNKCHTEEKACERSSHCDESHTSTCFFHFEFVLDWQLLLENKALFDNRFFVNM